MPPKKDAKGAAKDKGGKSGDKGGKSGGKGAKAAEVKGIFLVLCTKILRPYDFYISI